MDVLRIIAGVVIALFVLLPISFAIIGTVVRAWQHLRRPKTD